MVFSGKKNKGGYNPWSSCFPALQTHTVCIRAAQLWAYSLCLFLKKMFVTCLMIDRAPCSFVLRGLSSLRSYLSWKCSSLHYVTLHCSHSVLMPGPNVWKGLKRRRWWRFTRFVPTGKENFKDFIALGIRIGKSRAVYLKGCLWMNRRKGRSLLRWEKVCLRGWGLANGLWWVVNLFLCLALWSSQNRFGVQTFSLEKLKGMICFLYHIWSNIICWSIIFEAKTSIWNSYLIMLEMFPLPSIKASLKL